MATLVKERSKNPFRTVEPEVAAPDGRVPAPFPTLQLKSQNKTTEELSVDLTPQDVAGPAHLTTEVDPAVREFHNCTWFCFWSSRAVLQEDQEQQQQRQDMLASMTHVKQSCILTLNNLLSGSAEGEWEPIITTTRRHSMPAANGEPSTQPTPQSIAALQTLISNLRSSDSPEGMVQISAADDEASLIHELQRRMDSRIPNLPQSDAQLARALVSALAHLARLSHLASAADPQAVGETLQSPLTTQVEDSVYDTLQRQVSDFQSRKFDQQTVGSAPATVVETALLWSRIDEDLDSVLRLTRERH
jgi:hypothetical protein